MTLVIIFAILIALFGLAFVTRRRFGVLGLALAAGVVLSQNATKYVADFLQQQSLPLAPLTPMSAASIIIILLPALVLLLGGPIYSTKRAAIIGAVGFALLGTFFVIGPLMTALPPQDATVRDGLTLISKWQGIIVIAALIAALADTFMAHGVKKRHDRKHAKH